MTSVPLVVLALVLLAAEMILGLVLYYGFSALSYWYFFEHRRATYFPDEPRPDAAEITRARRLALWGTLGNAVFALPFHLLALRGHSRIYMHVADRGWCYYVFSFFAFLAFTELFVYWAHRLLHHPFLYRHFHLAHHRFRKPTPWVSFAFHPVDSFAQAFPHYLCALLLPVHISIYVGFIVFLMFWSFFIHDRVSLVRVKLVNYAAHHTLHHRYNKDNYGQFLTVCDRLFGTYRNPMIDASISEELLPRGSTAAANAVGAAHRMTEHKKAA